MKFDYDAIIESGRIENIISALRAIGQDVTADYIYAQAHLHRDGVYSVAVSAYHKARQSFEGQKLIAAETPQIYRLQWKDPDSQEWRNMDIRYYPNKRIDLWQPSGRFERFSIKQGHLEKTLADESFEKQVRRHVHIIDEEKRTIKEFQGYIAAIEQFLVWLAALEPSLFFDHEDQLRPLIDIAASFAKAKLPARKYIRSSLSIAVEAFRNNEPEKGKEFLNYARSELAAEIFRIESNIIKSHETDIHYLVNGRNGARLSSAVDDRVGAIQLYQKLKKEAQELLQTRINQYPFQFSRPFTRATYPHELFDLSLWPAKPYVVKQYRDQPILYLTAMTNQVAGLMFDRITTLTEVFPDRVLSEDELNELQLARFYYPSGHNLIMTDIARFFTEAQKAGVVLNVLELRLLQDLLQADILQVSEKGYEVAQYFKKQFGVKK
jgi:hypothetical protein